MAESIELAEYDPDWPRRFRAERERIAAELGPLALSIEHNGSTSVPGLAAKPIIDIQVSVERLQPLDAYASRLARLGYVHVPHPDDSFCPFFHRPAVWPHTHHVHVVEAGGEEERRTLAFRDYLREHDGVAREYQELKRRLASRYEADSFASRQAYADAKGELIAAVVARALAEGYPRESIRTSRLILEPLSPDHRKAIREIYFEPSVRRYLLSRPRDEAEFDELFNRMLEMSASLGMWAMRHAASGNLIGRCGFYSFSETRTPELAILLAPSFSGAGLATEASRACLDHAFLEREWPAVVALVRPANAAAIRVLTKLAMRAERELELNGGTAVLYRIPRSEHRTRTTCIGGA